VPATGWHLEDLAGAVGVLAAFRGDRHRAFENKQSRVEFVGVRGIDLARLHAPVDHLAIALFAQPVFENRSVHRIPRNPEGLDDSTIRPAPPPRFASCDCLDQPISQLDSANFANFVPSCRDLNCLFADFQSLFAAAAFPDGTPGNLAE